MMAKIDEFVYDAQSGKQLIFNIASNSLKKALSKEVTRVYINTGIFTEFQRNLPQTVVKKTSSIRVKIFWVNTKTIRG